MDLEVSERAAADHGQRPTDRVPALADGELLPLDRLVAESCRILRVVVAPAGTSPGVRGVAVAVDDDFGGCGYGDLLVGVDLSGAEAVVSALEEAGCKRVAALVVREDHLSAGIVESAWRNGVALLSVRSRTSWQVVHRLIDEMLRNAPAAPDLDLGDVNDLFELCEVYASSLGGPVAIEDSGFSIVAYSSRGDVGDEYRQQAILQRRTLDDWLTTLSRKGILRRLRSTDKVIPLGLGEVAPNSHSRLLAGIHSGDELLGVIWACAGEEPFPADAVSIITEFADLAAPVLFQRRIAQASRYDRIGNLLLDLLEGSGDHRPLLEAWNRSNDAILVLAALQSSATTELDTAELARLLTMQIGSLATPAAVAAVGSVVYVLAVASSDEDTTAAGFANDISRMRCRVEGRYRVQLLTALAAPRRAAQVRNARLEVDRVLRCLRHPSATVRTAYFADVVPLVTLHELEDFFADRPYLRSDKLSDVLEHDRKRGTSYFATLRAFLDALGDVNKGAEAVSLHPNSFRYRVRRLVDLFGLELDDPEERLLLQLHLRCGQVGS